MKYHQIQQFYLQLISSTIFIFIADLKYARYFSARNGFGPVPLPPMIVPLDDENFLSFWVLNTLLTNMIAAEEAAIQQISPLIFIKSLHGGNLAVKGTRHQGWQKCKLVTILPNLPGHVKCIIIHRSKNATPSDECTIRSTKFEIHRIQPLLLVLKFKCKP